MSTDLREGDELSGLTILERIGQGAMGTVFSAKRDGELVAVKVLHPHLFERKTFFRRFQREAMAGAKVRHPGVVRIHECDFVLRDGMPCCFLVMEHLSGKSLRRILVEERVLPAEGVREIGVQALQGLSAVHEAGIIHRDLKPDNLHIRDDGTVCITDLGLTRVEGVVTTMTAEGRFGGTLGYAAPEQIVTGEATVASDLYSLGVVLLEASLGLNPFLRDTPEETARAHHEVKAPSPRDIDPDFPQSLHSAIRSLIEKDPGQRYPSAGIALEAIRREG
ncbi:MAG: serine/threonine-protein kinase [Planctomycetota bacterium]